MSHRHVERGPDCRSASSPRGTSSYTWDEPSTASLPCDSCGDEKGGPNRPTRRRSFSSSPGGSLPRGPHQIRTWRFPPSGSSADVARGSRATTVRSCGDMIRRRRSAGHGSLRTITPTRAAFARPGPGGYPFPGVIARMQPSDSLIPIGLGSGRPLPSAYPGARATRSNEGLPGVRAVLFQRAVVVDPAGCGALLAHGAGPAVAFRLHEALGTQEDVVSRLQGLRPTRSRTYASATALPRSPQGSLPAWVGWPLTGRGSHPLDDTQGFMTYSSIPLDRPAWPHHATTPRRSTGAAAGPVRRVSRSPRRRWASYERPRESSARYTSLAG